MATPPSELPDPSSLPASWSTGSSPVGGTAEMAGDPAQAPPDDGVPNAAATAAAGGTEKKKTAWKNSCASNGVMNASSPVMGAVSWPALSEASSMASARSSAHSGVFLNGVSHGSSSAAPVIETNSNSSSSSVPAPLKDEQTKDHGVFSGSAKVENGSGPVAGGGPAAPAIYLPETGRARNSENGSRGGRGLPQAQGGNELRSSYSGNRRGGSINNGWGGPNRSNHQNWRGHGWRRGYDWNHRPSAPGGGALPVHPVHNLQHPQARGMGWYFPPRHISHSPQPFYHPPATVPPPFGCPVEYYGIPPPPPPFPPPPPPFPPPPPPLPPPSPSMYYGPPHAFVQDPSYTEPSPLFYAEPTLDLLDVLTRQIDYYFSEENLCKDKFLRKHMDDNGWVSLYLIARFNQVKYLTNNMLVILDAVSASTVVELEGLKVRRRNDWMRWPSLRHLATPIIGEDLINRLALNMDEDLP